MKTDSILKAQHSYYQTRLDKFNNLWISNIDNSQANRSPKNLNFKLDDHQINTQAKCFEQALGLNRIKELASAKEFLSINFILSADGNVLEVEFVSKPNTLLTIHEIETLELALKNTIRYDIAWLDDNEPDMVLTGGGLPYDTILYICLGRTFTEDSVLKKMTTTVKIQPPPPNI